MNVGNKYILRLHYNYEDKRQSPNLEKFPYNNGLKYQLYEDHKNSNIGFYVIALYDEGFAGNYIPDSTTNEKMSLYGSLSTRGYYYFAEDRHNPGEYLFSFLSIYPSKFNLSLQESLKFANGVIENTNGEVYAEGYDDGVDTGLALLSHDKLDGINWYLCSKNQTYNYDSPSGQKNNCDVNYTDSCRKLIISESDIKLEPSQQINPGAKYVIKPCTPISQSHLPDKQVPVCIYDDTGKNKIGELSTTYSFVSINSIQPTPVKLAIGSIEGYGTDKNGSWDFDADHITLYRDEKSGEFRYYFSNKKGEKTSNTKLQNYCDSSIPGNENNCKMKDLNLFPNVRAYIKSTLTSADIADFQGTGTVDATAVSLNVTNTLKNDPDFQKAVTGVYGQDGQDANSAEIAHRLAHNTRFKRSLKGDDGADPAQVAEELVTAKFRDLGKAILQTPISAPGGTTLEDYVRQDMPKEIAKDVDVHKAVATELRNNPGRARGPEGPAGQDGVDGARGPQGIQGDRGPDGRPGNNGQDADPARVAEELVTTKAPELGTAVLDATGSGGNLATQVATKVNLNPQELIDRVDTTKLTEGVVGKITPQDAKKFAEDTVNAIISSAAKPDSYKKYEKFAEKLAELLINKSAMTQLGADALVRKGVAGWALAFYLIARSGLDNSGAAFSLAEQKVDREKLAELLLYYADLNYASKAGATVDHILSHFFNTRAGAITAALRNKPGRARGPKGDQGETGEDGEQGQDADPVEVTHRLAHNTRFKRSLKGDDGADGERGEKGDDGPQGIQGLQGLQGNTGAPGPAGQKGDDGRDADPAEVTHRLAHNTRFKRSLKGDDGADGERGLKGDPGDPGKDGEVGPKGPQGRDGERGERGERGKDGVDSFPLDSESKRSIGELQKKPQLKVVPGESYNENKQEANIELDGVGVIATFLEIGYFFKNDDLYIRDHITGNNILIPKHFHFLTVVEDDFNNYKLAFCNNLGNLFFNYQKYAPEYAGVLEEYKLIDLRYIKNAANIDLSKYYFHHIHTPLFAVRKGEPEGQSLENYGVDVYEIARNKKIGTLVDEFGFFERDQFHYVNHHQGYDHHSQEPNVRIENHEGNFQIDDHIIHPITLHDGRFDLLDYLSYS